MDEKKKEMLFLLQFLILRIELGVPSPQSWRTMTKGTSDFPLIITEMVRDISSWGPMDSFKSEQMLQMDCSQKIYHRV